MKVSKLIIPLLGISSINNANNQELLRLEKLPQISHEISVKDNLDNYHYLTNGSFVEFVEIQSQNIPLENNGIVKVLPIEYSGGCEALYASIVAACQALWFVNPSQYGPCMRAAWNTYLACLHG